ncbi:hypothetical protein CcCBS67573_g09740 [Chytriomyces confervae]|uniref:Velvet domain-containing protein n=1 Tax=Chytriomyces confervae TaxID=246404 RepID=A0A507DPN1_9FUNG|nr:hypothetical protein CcCBS67573_g09740 [Chytriomyces confervae]
MDTMTSLVNAAASARQELAANDKAAAEASPSSPSSSSSACSSAPSLAAAVAPDTDYVPGAVSDPSLVPHTATHFRTLASDPHKRGNSKDRLETSNNSALFPTKTVALEILQQPEFARVSGNAAGDRRPIHPPPIIKLCGDRANDTTPYIMFVSLWTVNLQRKVSYFPRHADESHMDYKLINPSESDSSDDANPRSKKRVKYDVLPVPSYSQSQILMGPLVSISTPLYDVQQNWGQFFVYPDLAVRSSGKYRLRFDMYEMATMAYQKNSPIATCYSDVFSVCNPKEYPGISPSTALTRCFARQGVKVRVRAGDDGKCDDGSDS